jgi:hypothetical protein
MAPMLAELISAGHPSGLANPLELAIRAFARWRLQRSYDEIGSRAADVSRATNGSFRSNLLIAAHLGEWPESARLSHLASSALRVLKPTFEDRIESGRFARLVLPTG